MSWPSKQSRCCCAEDDSLTAVFAFMETRPVERGEPERLHVSTSGSSSSVIDVEHACETFIAALKEMISLKGRSLYV